MVSSVRANAVNCVKGEIHNVLTVLRLNARWATKARFTTEIALQAESPLIRALKSLHAYLEAVDDLGDVDTVRYLEPFLAVVESPHTTGPMTGAALSSLHKFLLYGFMATDSPRAGEGIDRIARGISRFHFEETDPESDEVVLMKVSHACTFKHKHLCTV
jgi:golgi-specific brefeldin A-resistance guanine nucleotide exchange factor 1